jgi:hypothetical protein
MSIILSKKQNSGLIQKKRPTILLVGPLNMVAGAGFEPTTFGL